MQRAATTGAVAVRDVDYDFIARQVRGQGAEVAAGPGWAGRLGIVIRRHRRVRLGLLAGASRIGGPQFDL